MKSGKAIPKVRGLMRVSMLIAMLITCTAWQYVKALTPSDPTSASPAENELTIPEMIEESSNGNVEILISSDLLEKILEAPHGRPKTTRRQGQSGPKIKEGLNKIRGFRIQVFNDGRNQSTLETKARARGSSIAAKFPKYRGQIYTYSSAPNWITRVGNFRTSSEAQAALSELKAAFPQFAGEMRIVNSDIYVVK